MGRIPLSDKVGQLCGLLFSAWKKLLNRVNNSPLLIQSVYDEIIKFIACKGIF